jgi:hypothetical protein
MQKAQHRINMKKYIQRHIALSGNKYERQWRRVCFFWWDKKIMIDTNTVTCSSKNKFLKG